MILRSAPAAALVVLATLVPAPAAAQFTSYVGPRRKAVDTAKVTVVQKKARADSVERMSLASMKAWVDSAAGVAPPPAPPVPAAPPARDSFFRRPPPPPAEARRSPPNNAEQRHRTTTFSNGAIAPNTASSLPALALGGCALVGAGVILLRSRARRAPPSDP